MPISASPPDRANRDGCAKYLQVVMIDFVLETGFADLVQTLELVKINGVAVRHDQSMKDHSQARLSEALDSLRLSHDLCAGRDEQALSVV